MTAAAILRRDRGQALLGHGAMFIFSALVAGSFAFGTRFANDIDPLALTAIRFLLAGAIIGGLMVALGKHDRAHWQAPWRYLVLGGSFAAYFALMFVGLRTASAISTSAVFTLAPILAAGFAWILLRQRTSRRVIGALCIGAIGALWVIFQADLSALLAFDLGRGELIYFFGLIFHAAYAPMVAKLNRGEPALAFTFGTLVAGFLVLSVVGAPAILATSWLDLPARAWWGILYLAVFSSAASFFLLQFAALRLPAAKVMAYTYLTPSWVIGWEIVLGGEVPPPIILIGVGMSIVALLLLLRNEDVRG